MAVEKKAPRKAPARKTVARKTRAPRKKAATIETAYVEPTPVILPRPKTNPVRAVVMLMLGIFALAALLFAVMHAARPAPAPTTATPVVVTDPVFAEISSKPEFQAWLKTWQGVEPYVSVAEFSVAVAASKFRDEATAYATSDGQAPELANRRVWSPRQDFWVDYLLTYGKPQTTLGAYDRERGEWTLATCDASCGYDGAFWLDDSRVVVFGTQAAQNLDNTPTCIDGTCYRRLTVDLFDFGTGTRQTYASGRHAFARQPFDDARHDRWVGGLTAEEKTAYVATPSGQTIVLRATILEVATKLGEGGIVSYQTADKQPRFIAISPSAVIHDEGNNISQIDVVTKGSEVEMTASRTPEGVVTVFSVRVLQAASIDKTP